MPFLLVASLTSLAAAVALPAPVTQVTVYSDRARVMRSGNVAVSGTQRFELPLLLDNVNPATIWVEASGADVRRVDIAHVNAEEFPSDEARLLLGKLEKIDDQIARLRGDQAAVQTVLAAIQRLHPAAPSVEPLRPPPKLNATGWAAVFSFVGTWSDRLQGRNRELDDKLYDLGRDRNEIVEKARLIGGAQRRAGFRVTPTLAGGGNAKVTLSYMVGNARWYPVYDLQLQSEKGQVQVAFAGRVSQETGEDWVDAAITLSTAVPATSTVVPKLFTWKIGERERFVPTPTPAVESVRPAPRAAPPLRFEPEGEIMRRRLLNAIGESVQDEKKDKKNEEPESFNGYDDQPDRDGDGIPDDVDGCPDDGSGGGQSGDDGCPAGDVTKEATGKGKSEYKARLVDLEKRTQELKQQVSRTRSRMAHVSEKVTATAESPPPPPAAPSPMVVAKAPGYSFQSAEDLQGASVTIAGGRFEQPTTQVGLAAPPGYRAPVYAPDLPASLAGGYDLSFPSLRPETVRSGKGPRRVALFSEGWPVGVERRLFPALAPDAFLVAEIKNPSQRVLPGGQASLFVGDDPAGTATLKVVAPGETFTLPLGLDRSVKPVRNVKLVLSEKGVFSKDEINQYLVSSEVANPYRVPLKVRIVDQVPLSTDKNVEVKLITDGGGKQDKLTGALEWLITVPPSGKSTVNFVYTVRRPKGWRLHQ